MSKQSLSVSVGAFVVLALTLLVMVLLLINGDGLRGKETQKYEVLFESSVKGLNVGAPVTLRGVKIGDVLNVRAQFFHPQKTVLNVVTVEIYPDTISTGDHDDTDIMPQLLQQGLAAQLDMQSVLTGLLYIEVGFPGGKLTHHAVKTQYPQIPTVPGNLEEIMRQVEQVDLATIANNLDKILENLATVTDQDQLGHLITNADESFTTMKHAATDLAADMSDIRVSFDEMSGSADRVVAIFNAQIPALVTEMNKTLAQADNTLLSAQDVMDPESPLMYQLLQMSKELTRTSRAVDDLAKLLQQQPDALIFGRSKENGHEE